MLSYVLAAGLLAGAAPDGIPKVDRQVLARVKALCDCSECDDERRQTLETLGQAGRDAVLLLLADRDRPTSYCGIDLERFSLDARAAPMLRRFAADTTVHIVLRGLAFRTLARIGDAEGLTIALGLVGTKDEKLQELVIDVLTQYAHGNHDEKAQAALREWLARSEPGTTSSLLGAVGADPKAVDLLMGFDGMDVCLSLLTIGDPKGLAVVPDKLRVVENGLAEIPRDGYQAGIMQRLVYLWKLYLEKVPDSPERQEIERHIARFEAERSAIQTKARVEGEARSLQGDWSVDARAFATLSAHPLEAAKVLVAEIKVVDPATVNWWEYSYNQPPESVRVVWQVRALQYITGGLRFKAQTSYTFGPDEKPRQEALGAVTPHAELPFFAERAGSREQQRLIYLAPKDVQEAIIAKWREWLEREGATCPYKTATDKAAWFD